MNRERRLERLEQSAPAPSTGDGRRIITIRGICDHGRHWALVFGVSSLDANGHVLWADVIGVPCSFCGETDEP